MEKTRFTFKKGEKLKKKKEIELLFSEGKSFHIYPLRWVWMKKTLPEDINYPIRAGVSVSKRKFKLAVERNRVKRLMREALRKNKHILSEKIDKDSSYSIMLIYTGKKEEKISYITKRLIKGIGVFLKEIEKQKEQ